MNRLAHRVTVVEVGGIVGDMSAGCASRPLYSR
jgi:hypothetical protein